MKVLHSTLLFSLIFLCVISSVNPQGIDISKNWKFKIGDDLKWMDPKLDEEDWKPISIEKWWDDQGYKNQGYAWYRVKFVIPSSLKNNAYLKDSLRIYLGKIDECDQTFLNGKSIGENAGLKSSKFETLVPAWTAERNYVISIKNPAILWDKENVIAIRVHNSSGAGGMYRGKPAIKMTELTDYIKIAADDVKYSASKSNMFENKISITNTSVFYKAQGKMNVTVVADNKTGKKLFEKDIEITIDPLKNFSTILYYPMAENETVNYKFTEKKSLKTIERKKELPYILTPKAAKSPQINGAKIFGVRPGSPFLFTIPATGEKPMRFFADKLPKGLNLNKNTGMITGSIVQKGKYPVKLRAENKFGKYSRDFTIVCGDTLALTPHMGWNSWYVWENHVTDKIMRNAADAMAASGMINYGYMYINIDDCWMVKPDSKDKELAGQPRNAEGKINSNSRFPDMKALTDYIHSKGLKAGIYTSPGKQTCAGFTAAYQFEELDVLRFAEWGFDFLKYDWCSYDDIAKDHSIPELQKPYRLISSILAKQKRDIVLNLCQYGMGNVWEWGREVGGHSWRTAGDLGGSFEGIGAALFRDGFDVYAKNNLEKYSAPGAWNDPDYLLLGYLSNWKGETVPTPLTPNEQYTHVSLWSLLAAPLIFSGDITRLDSFTLNLLTNNEVIEVDQDPLGKGGRRVFKEGNSEVWMKEMEDGSIAVGLFNRGEIPVQVTAKWADLNIKNKYRVRDLWRQKELGVFESKFSSEVPRHGVTLVRMWKEKLKI
ncbi:MAG: hypothetical protein C0412_09760 [Flavobacterium sp.]|nr:hypothetical protein [Flavobacterium sp.]